MNTAQTRTLQRALKITGSMEALAAALDTDVATLKRWLSGEARATTQAYLKALDIVAEGPRS